MVQFGFPGGRTAAIALMLSAMAIGAQADAPGVEKPFPVPGATFEYNATVTMSDGLGTGGREHVGCWLACGAQDLWLRHH